MKSYNSGKMAELLAKIYMLLHGYSVVTSNYVTGKGTTAGEIDFIARQHKLLVFVEVKKRQNITGAAYAISEKQKQRIIRGAQAFLSRNPQFKNFDLRFDAILVAFPFRLRHIKNAWTL